MPDMSFDLLCSIADSFVSAASCHLMFIPVLLRTPLKTNMSPENQWLEDVFPIEMVPF